MKIRNNFPTPLAMEYSAQKKLNAQSNKSVSYRTIDLNSIQNFDPLTLSTDQQGDNNSLPKPKPSTPVTTEEQRSLYSTFSVQA